MLSSFGCFVSVQNKVSLLINKGPRNQLRVSNHVRSYRRRIAERKVASDEKSSDHPPSLANHLSSLQNIKTTFKCPITAERIVRESSNSMSLEQKEKLEKSGLVEWSVFSELVAMDEDEEEFSKGLCQTFVNQFKDTAEEIDENLESKNLEKLSSLGHYLKGSAAALGLKKISSQCERIQNYGHRVNFDNHKPDKELDEESDEFWIQLIRDAVKKARLGFEELKAALDEYFEDEL